MLRFAVLSAFTCASALTISSPAQAAPGLGQEVYGATVEEGEVELESRYDRLTGGPSAGEDVLKLEAAYSVSDRLRIGVTTHLAREPGLNRKVEEVGFEAIYHLGRVGGIDVALYGEYAVAIDGTDDVETKLLLERKQGPLDIRFNLIATKPLDSHRLAEFSYAASADVKTLGEVRLGIQAFGDLGTVRHLVPRAEHFVGPVAKFEIEGLGPEVGLELGYLFALGAARDETSGQVRIALEVEF